MEGRPLCFDQPSHSMTMAMENTTQSTVRRISLMKHFSLAKGSGGKGQNTGLKRGGAIAREPDHVPLGKKGDTAADAQRSNKFHPPHRVGPKPQARKRNRSEKTGSWFQATG